MFRWSWGFKNTMRRNKGWNWDSPLSPCSWAPPSCRIARGTANRWRSRPAARPQRRRWPRWGWPRWCHCRIHARCSAPCRCSSWWSPSNFGLLRGLLRWWVAAPITPSGRPKLQRTSARGDTRRKSVSVLSRRPCTDAPIDAFGITHSLLTRESREPSPMVLLAAPAECRTPAYYTQLVLWLSTWSPGAAPERDSLWRPRDPKRWFCGFVKYCEYYLLNTDIYIAAAWIMQMQISAQSVLRWTLSNSLQSLKSAIKWNSNL